MAKRYRVIVDMANVGSYIREHINLLNITKETAEEIIRDISRYGEMQEIEEESEDTK